MGVLRGFIWALYAACSCTALACGNGRLDAFESQPSGLIDDFEDLNNHAAYDVGWWFIVNDGTGTQSYEIVPPGDRPGDKGALHSSGSGFTGWGAEVGVSLSGTGAGGSYDASRFSALEFSAKSAGGANSAMTVWFVDQAHSYSYPATLTSGWAPYHVPFAAAVYSGDSTLRLDSAQLICIQFSFSGSSTFDLWLDDVAFVSNP